ncbi:ornithine cyclodeaminase family protein [Streptomyces sp. NPDC003333]
MNTDTVTFFGPDRIRAAVGTRDVLEPVRQALVDHSRALGEAPAVVFAPAGREGDVHVKSAWLPGRSVFTVKVASWFLARKELGLPPGSGIVAAFDAATGDLRALLEDDHHLSDIRTAAAGALGARALATPHASVLGVVGTGVQGYLQALAVADSLPVRAVHVWGRDPAAVRRVVDALAARRRDLDVRPAPDLARMCGAVDVLVTATSSTEPLIRHDWLRPGVHVNAVGADDPFKAELTEECFRRAHRVVVDSRALNRLHGELSRVQDDDIEVVELGAVLSGDAPGRSGDEDITICKLIGLGVQDLAAAETALKRLHAGTHVSDPPSALDLLPE